MLSKKKLQQNQAWESENPKPSFKEIEKKNMKKKSHPDQIEMNIMFAKKKTQNASFQLGAR